MGVERSRVYAVGSPGSLICHRVGLHVESVCFLGGVYEDKCLCRPLSY